MCEWEPHERDGLSGSQPGSRASTEHEHSLDGCGAPPLGVTPFSQLEFFLVSCPSLPSLAQNTSSGVSLPLLLQCALSPLAAGFSPLPLVLSPHPELPGAAIGTSLHPVEVDCKSGFPR